MRMLWVGVIPLIINIVLFGVIMWYGDRKEAIDFNEVSALLTASAIVLTGTAVIVAVLAAIGYQDIRGRSESAARETAARIARETATLEARRAVEDMTRSKEEEEGAEEIADPQARGE